MSSFLIEYIGLSCMNCFGDGQKAEAPYRKMLSNFEFLRANSVSLWAIMYVFLLQLQVFRSCLLEIEYLAFAAEREAKELGAAP